MTAQFKTRVEVTTNNNETRRVFVRFTDADAKNRATKILKAARKEAPLGKTGELRAGLKMSQSRDTKGQWASGYDVISTAPHTLFVIDGTRPHKIEGKPLLAFFWPKVGGFVVFHSVNHPGTRANNFLARALKKGRR